MEPLTAATIEDLVTAGRIIEARTLLTVHETELSEHDRQELNATMDRLQARAEALIAEAEALERAGKIQEAKACCESILVFACDYPGLDSRLKHLDESLSLTKAVQHRSRRIRQSAAMHPPAPANRSRLLLGLGATGLVLALAAAVLFTRQPQTPVVQPLTVSPPPAPTAPAAAPSPQVAAATDKPALPDTLTAQAERTTPVASLPAEAPPQPAPKPAPTPQPELKPEGTPEEKPVPQPASSPAPAAAATARLSAAEPQHQAAPAAPAPPVPPKTEPVTALHTVQSGESLSLIADRVLCRENAWREIYQQNRDQVKDADKLQPGMELNLTGIESRCHQAGAENEHR